ncbi:hypothetical protein, partial [Kitasatospora sp. NPDC005856]|uniref:hypothetical protein n=1 Tax=Kitasatospora sp. NPDC005856 TaxID=3154566 RepID=UPI0033F75E02
YGKALESLDLAWSTRATGRREARGRRGLISTTKRSFLRCGACTRRRRRGSGTRPARTWDLLEEEQYERMPEELAASMDDEAIFGSVAWKFRCPTR